MLTEGMDFFSHGPSNEMLDNRAANEAYCLSNKAKEYAIYFPDKGEVTLNALSGNYEVSWLKISDSKWVETKTMKLPGEIKTPSDEPYAVLIKPAK
jgi:hypothetical protein